MNSGPMRVPVVVAAAAALLLPAAAQARPRKKAKAAAKAGAGAPACGVTILPLVPGTQWTYNPVPAPMPAPDAIARIAPAKPTQIVITVKSVEAKGGDTVVTLEESFQYDRTKDKEKPLIEDRSISTTITCNDKKFDISPDSFFFAGEPGGSVNLDVTKIDHIKGTSIQLTKGAIGDAQWGEDLVLTWSQKPTEKTNAKLPSGKLEMERRFTPQPVEAVTTKMGTYKAEKLGLVTTGRVTLDEHNEKTKPMELPANWISTLWLADGVGMVQALNSYGHMYQLVDSGSAKDRPAEGAPADDAKPADAAPAKAPA